MSSPRSAVALLRSLDLMPDGPARWGEPVRSRAPGVLLVEAARSDTAPLDITAVRAWLQRVPSLRLDGERPTPTQLAERLAVFWLPQQTVVYVGRTSKSLAGRAASLFATTLGDRKPHSGGHWLGTLLERDKLRIWWAETTSPEEYEDALHDAIAEDVEPGAADRLRVFGPILPWANLTAVTGDAKRTGITGSLLADGDTGAHAAPNAPHRAPVAPGRRAPNARPRATTSKPRVTSPKAPARPPNARPPAQMTAAGLAAMEAEVLELTTLRRPEVIQRVKHARELGDLRENADYEAARNEQAFLEGRIRELEQTLRTAVVARSHDSGVVHLGSRVEVEVEGLRTTLHIVGSSEADPGNGRISDASPVGRALLGRRAGDEVVVQAPGRQVHYRVVEVSAA